MKRHFTAFFLIALVTLMNVLAANTQSKDACLLLYDTDITYEDGKLTMDYRIRIQINSKAGEHFTHVKIPFKGENKPKKIHAQIMDMNGTVMLELKKSDVLETNAFSRLAFYQDRFVKEFKLGHHTYPYVFEYTYRETVDEFIAIEHWTPVLAYDIPTKDASLTFSAPSDFQFSYLMNHVAEPWIIEEKGQMKLVWEANYSGELEKEMLAPDMQAYLPKVVIMPHEFFYEKSGKASNWQEYGDWERELLKGLTALPLAEKRKIDQLLADQKSRRDSIKILYHYLQDETRYINVSIGTGGMVPASASEVSACKYGDCKGLTIFFKAMLEYVGIDAYYTNIHAGNPIYQWDLDFPSQQANHVILMVPADNDTLWIDCTSSTALGYVGTFIQNRKSFVVGKDSSFFAQLPKLKKEEVLETRHIYGEVSSGQLSLAVENVFRGEEYEDFVYYQNALTEKQVREVIQERYCPKNYQLLDHSLFSSHRDSSLIQMNYSALSKNAVKQYGEEQLLSVLPVPIPRFEKPVNRSMPVQIEFPINRLDSIYYSLPNGSVVQGEYPSIEHLSKYGKYTVEFAINKDHVSLVRTFQLRAGMVALDEYADFYEFLSAIVREDSRLKIIFTASVL